MDVLDGVTAHRQGAGTGIDGGGRRHQALLQGGGDDEGLDGGAGLHDVGDGAIPAAALVIVLTAVGVVGWLIDHGQDLPGADIQHHRRGRLRLVFPYRAHQLPVGEILQPPVDAQFQVLAVTRWAHSLHLGDQLLTTVLDDPAQARFGAQPAIEGQFHALDAFVVDIREADDMAEDLPARIEALVLSLHAQFMDLIVVLDTGNILGLIGFDAALKVDEAFVLPLRHPLTQVLDGQSHRLGQFTQRLGKVLELAGIGPDAGHGGTDRQGFAVAVEDHSPPRRDLPVTQIAGLALLTQEFSLQHLALEGTRHHGAEQDAETAEQYQAPPPEIEALTLAGRVALAPGQINVHEPYPQWF